MRNEPSSVNGRPVPWTALEVVLALFLVWWFWTAASYQALLHTGFYRHYYGPEFVALTEDASRGKDSAEAESCRALVVVLALFQGRAPGLAAGPAAAAAATPLLRQLAFYRMSLWSNALAFPFQVLTIPVLFFAASRTHPSQLGLTTRRWGRNLLAGVVGALILTPIVVGLNLFVSRLYQAWTGEGGIQEHPLTRIAGQHLWPAEWVLLVFSAVVSAAVLEELIFRGVLQPWLAGHTWGGHAGMAAAFGMALMSRSERIREAWAEQGWPLLEACVPALFVAALVPVYLVVCRRSRTPAGPAVFATAVLFASVHSFAWPTPVALFVLALGLGILAWRSHSLVGPITLHGLFNGANCVVLFWYLLHGGR